MFFMSAYPSLQQSSLLVNPANYMKEEYTLYLFTIDYGWVYIIIIIMMSSFR